MSRDYTITDTRFFDQTNGFTALEPLMAMMAETFDGTVWMAGVEEMTSFCPATLLERRMEDTYISCYALTSFLLVICPAAFRLQWNPIAHSKQQDICSKIKAVFIIMLMTDSG